MTKMRRADRAISREDALAVIDRCAYGTLSLIATDGTPYAVALNVVRDGEKLFFHSAMAGLKVDSLRENPQVCLLFVENPTIYEKGLTTLYTSTVVRGILDRYSGAMDLSAAGGSEILRIIINN